VSLPITKYKVIINLSEDMLGTTPKQKQVFTSYLTNLKREELGKQKRKNDREEEAAQRKIEKDNAEASKGKKKKKEVPEEDERPPQRLASSEELTTTTIETVVMEEEESIEEVEERGWTGFPRDQDGPFMWDYQLKGFLCEAARTIGQIGETKQLQDKVKRYCFVKPRRIRLPEPEEYMERPLRAQTAQGPRVALVRSDVIKAGASLEFHLWVLKGGKLSKSILKDVLEYGSLCGLLQWRTGGWGRFETVSLEELE
jgi:hypothetical protein